MMPTEKVQARNLQPGDRVGSGEIVLSVSAGVRTPCGKVEVVLEKNGRARMSLWGSHTLINVARKESTHAQ
jgi:MOSC domain-containing protein YiiM